MNMRATALSCGCSAVIERTRRELSRPPLEGTDTVLAAYENLMQAAVGVYNGDGGAAVYAPRGDGSFTIVALVARRAGRG
jgi:hypothetical protein